MRHLSLKDLSTEEFRHLIGIKPSTLVIGLKYRVRLIRSRGGMEDAVSFVWKISF
jgi:hypothetical protein